MDQITQMGLQNYLLSQTAEKHHSTWRQAVLQEAMRTFLLSAIALLVSASALNNVPVIGALVGSFFANIVILISAILLVMAFVTTFRWLQESA